MIDTCFAADHNVFDDKDTLIFGQDDAVGWVDTVAFDKTHDAGASQGWCPGVVDTNGDGKISTGWTEPNQPVDPKKDHRIDFGCYCDRHQPDRRQHLVLGHRSRGHRRSCASSAGANPPQSCKAEVYMPPPSKASLPYSGGVAIDSNGVVWQNWRGVHEILSFDRRKCKVLNGPTATGQQCPEGWTRVHEAGPRVQRGAADRTSTDMLYLTNIDHHDALGLGKDVLLAGDVNADSFFVADAAERPDEDVDAARAVSAGIPCAAHRRTHRRSERRLEGPRHVVELLDVHAMAPGRRQGIAAEGCEVPDAAESSREVIVP